ncbi:MAG TPA: YdcF family protein [Candidatus Fimimorpha excrementavium]|nr:YdcF family protein [Candidatus Fimimorpha excrementavium]
MKKNFEKKERMITFGMKKRGFGPAFFISLCLFPLMVFLGRAVLYMGAGLFLVVSGASLLALQRRESLSLRPRHFFGVLAGLVLFFLSLGSAFLSAFAEAGEWTLFGWSGRVLTLFLFYLYAVFFGVLMVSGWYAAFPPRVEADCILILGCALSGRNLTPILKKRTDRALFWYRRQIRQGKKAPLLIPSGGRGPDEPISEAAAIRSYLIQKGVPAEHIRIEDRSRNTKENMEFSFSIAKKQLHHSVCIFATTNYHLFRSTLWARRAGMSGLGIGAPTKWYYWPSAFVREFIGILYVTWPIHGAAAAVLILLSFL